MRTQTDFALKNNCQRKESRVDVEAADEKVFREWRSEAESSGGEESAESGSGVVTGKLLKAQQNCSDRTQWNELRNELGTE